MAATSTDPMRQLIARWKQSLDGMYGEHHTIKAEGKEWRRGWRSCLKILIKEAEDALAESSDPNPNTQ